MLDEWERLCSTLTPQTHSNSEPLPFNSQQSTNLNNNTNQININFNQMNNTQSKNPYSQSHAHQKQDNYMSQSKGQYPGQYTSQNKGQTYPPEANTLKGNSGLNRIEGNTSSGSSSYQPLQQAHPYTQKPDSKPPQNLQSISQTHIPSSAQWLQGGCPPSQSHTGHIFICSDTLNTIVFYIGIVCDNFLFYEYLSQCPLGW